MKWHLIEDKRHKFEVKVSYEIENAIDNIKFRNSENDKGLEDWGNYIDGIKCYISNPAIALDYMREFIHTHEDETYINKLGMEVGFTIGTDDITNKTYVYIFYLDLKASDFGLNESRSKNIICLTSSDLKHIITESVQRILQEQESKVGKRLGEYEVIDGRFASCKAPSLERFGYYNDVRMYYSPCHTYCLMRREDNGTLFFAEIVTAPELGKNQTKYVPRKPNEVPSFILRDAQSLLRKAKNQRIMIS